MIRLLSVSLVARCDSVLSCRRVRREYVSSCKLKVTRGRSYIWKPCGDIVLDPLSSCKKLEIRPKLLQNANTVFSLIASFSLTLGHILRSNQDMLCFPLEKLSSPMRFMFAAATAKSGVPYVSSPVQNSSVKEYPLQWRI